MLKSIVVDCDLLTSFWTFLKRQISRKTAKAKALLFKELGKTGTLCVMSGYYPVEPAVALVSIFAI
jgi:hypothetical protein